MSINLDNATIFEKTVSEKQLSVVHFCADWVEQCSQIKDVFSELAKQYKNVNFCNCPAEDLPDISLKHKIAAVPTVIFFHSGNVVDRVDGVDIAKITGKVKELDKNVGTSKGDSADVPLEERLKQLINKHKVMLFMKGNRETPRCGFSRQIIQILDSTSVEYETFDILSDEEVRQGLKTYSDWPTYPQLYVKGELLGGLDIIKEMQAGGDLMTALNG